MLCVIVKRSIFFNDILSTEKKKIGFTTYFDRWQIPIPYFWKHDNWNVICVFARRMLKQQRLAAMKNLVKLGGITFWEEVDEEMFFSLFIVGDVWQGV